MAELTTTLEGMASILDIAIRRRITASEPPANINNLFMSIMVKL